LWVKYRNTTNFPDNRNPLLCPLGGARTRLGMGLNRAVLLEASHRAFSRAFGFGRINLDHKGERDLCALAREHPRKRAFASLLRMAEFTTTSLRTGLLKAQGLPFFWGEGALALMDLAIMMDVCPRKVLYAFPNECTLTINRVLYTKKQSTYVELSRWCRWPCDQLQGHHLWRRLR